MFSLNHKTPPPNIWHLEGCFVSDGKKLPRMCAALIVETKNVYQTKNICYVQGNKKIDTGAPH